MLDKTKNLGEGVTCDLASGLRSSLPRRPAEKIGDGMETPRRAANMDDAVICFRSENISFGVSRGKCLW